MGLNLYASLAELKSKLDIDAVTDDASLTNDLRRASREIDRATGRTYFPTQATRYVNGSGSDRLWLPAPLLEASEVALSSDLGSTYTALGAGDYWLSDGKSWDATPYQLLALNPNGSYGTWYKGDRTVRIAGVWGWRPDYADAWEDSGDTVLDAALAASATQITVASSSGTDALGLSPRFAAGNLIKVDSEFCEVTATSATKLTVTRGANGTTAASHATGVRIYRWRPYELVEQATLTQAARWFKRAQQAYADAGANVELGRLVYAKRLDPDVEVILLEAGLKQLTVG
jgi:hypothetical protein